MPGLRLEGLADQAARELLDERFPGLPSAVRERLLAEAEGNPLALLELPTALSSGVRAGEAALPANLPVTARLEQAFAARTADLPPVTRVLLLVAAADDSGVLREIMAAGGVMAGVLLAMNDLDPAVGADLIQVDGSVVRVPSSAGAFGGLPGGHRRGAPCRAYIAG